MIRLAVVLLIALVTFACEVSPQFSTSEADKWEVASDCRTGFFRIGDKPAALFVSAVDHDTRVHHTIPAGDPVSATGNCSYYLVEVVHRNETGWVMKILLK